MEPPSSSKESSVPVNASFILEHSLPVINGTFHKRLTLEEELALDFMHEDLISDNEDIDEDDVYTPSTRKRKRTSEADGTTSASAESGKKPSARKRQKNAEPVAVVGSHVFVNAVEKTGKRTRVVPPMIIVPRCGPPNKTNILQQFQSSNEQASELSKATDLLISQNPAQNAPILLDTSSQPKDSTLSSSRQPKSSKKQSYVLPTITAPASSLVVADSVPIMATRPVPQSTPTDEAAAPKMAPKTAVPRSVPRTAPKVAVPRTKATPKAAPRTAKAAATATAAEMDDSEGDLLSVSSGEGIQFESSSDGRRSSNVYATSTDYNTSFSKHGAAVGPQTASSSLPKTAQQQNTNNCSNGSNALSSISTPSSTANGAVRKPSTAALAAKLQAGRTIPPNRPIDQHLLRDAALRQLLEKNTPISALAAEIIEYLTHQHGWTSERYNGKRIYDSSGKALDLSPLGEDIILRPGLKRTGAQMLVNYDYFTVPECVVEYLEYVFVVPKPMREAVV